MRPTILIPAAGRGERLSLPIPKELLPIGAGKVAIDATFDILRPHSTSINIVVIFGSHKLETVKYLERYQNDFNMAFVFQKPALPGLVGALRSAETFFSEKILLLLPDQILSLSPQSQNPITESLRIIENSPVCFIAALERDLNRLKEDGALSLKQENGTYFVKEYLEKPPNPPSTLNAIWAGVGFNKSVANRVFDTIEDCINQKLDHNHFCQSPLYHAPAVLIDNYADLGTWSKYKDWIIQRS